MTKVILVSNCSMCPYHIEEKLTGVISCNNPELIEQDIKIPKKVGNITKLKTAPKFCPLVDLEMVQN
jgi:hypothetical protein